MSTGFGQIHELEPEAVYGVLRSRAAGLTEREVVTRRQTVGPNRLKPPSRWGWVRRLGKHFVNFFSILLDVAAGVCFLAASLQQDEGMQILGWALGGVSVLNSLFAFAQELRAEHAMAELAKFLPQRVRVRREGRELSILAEELVPGDLLLLSEGDRIAADARLVESEELLVNNAPLTGESRSIALHTQACTGRLVESANITFAGCSVLRGQGMAVVFATGHRTEFGKIAAFSRDVTRERCPLQRETVRMVRILTVIAVAMGLLFFAYGVISGRSLWINIVFMLGIIVANVPEGLLPTFTLALSMASLRMARKQVLVKNLEAVETLGAVHVICTDKTGTLTENALAVSALIDPVDGKGLESPEERWSLLRVAMIASEVRPATKAARTVRPKRHLRSRRGAPAMRFVQMVRLLLGLPRWRRRRLSETPSGSEKRPISNWPGDPLDIAVVEHYAARCGSPSAILSEVRRHFPFDLARRREAGLLVNRHEAVFAVKGAWESLQPLLSQIRDREGNHLPVSVERLAQCELYVRSLASQGQRVIAVAARTFPYKTITCDTTETAGINVASTPAAATSAVTPHAHVAATKVDAKDAGVNPSTERWRAAMGNAAMGNAAMGNDPTASVVSLSDALGRRTTTPRATGPVTASHLQTSAADPLGSRDDQAWSKSSDAMENHPVTSSNRTLSDRASDSASAVDGRLSDGRVISPSVSLSVNHSDSVRTVSENRETSEHRAGEPEAAESSETWPVGAEASEDRLASESWWLEWLKEPTQGAGANQDEASRLLETDLVLYGFLALEDPVRSDVAEAVDRCQAAGIQVLMVTGDHPDTAVAIARRCHILPEEGELSGQVVLGAELQTLREQQLVDRLAGGATIFARTSPEQKMKIVSAWKRLGKTVAMTGDGVNDSPALKAADVGIAMGVSGTEVAREAADLVLLDDHFASIVAGIEEGRAVFANMQKFTTYVLSSNVPEIVPFLLFIVLPVPLALTVIQILSIDLGTDLLPAIGLGQEPPDRQTMQRPPRRWNERLLSLPVMINAYLFLGLLQAIYSLSLFFLVLGLGGWRWGMPLAESAPLYRSATGITLASVILMQIGNVLGRRSETGCGLDRGLWLNPLLLTGIALEILFSWSILYFPPVQKVLQTGPVELWVYALAWGGIPWILGWDWLRKSLAAKGLCTH